MQIREPLFCGEEAAHIGERFGFQFFDFGSQVGGKFVRRMVFMPLTILVSYVDGNCLFDLNQRLVRTGFWLEQGQEFTPKVWGFDRGKTLRAKLGLAFEGIAAGGAVHRSMRSRAIIAPRWTGLKPKASDIVTESRDS